MKELLAKSVVCVLVTIAALRAESVLAQSVGVPTCIPKSNKFFEGKIRFSDGSEARFEGREGSIVKIIDGSDGQTFTGLCFTTSNDQNKLRVMILKLTSSSVLGGSSMEISLNKEFEVHQSAPIVVWIQKIGEREFLHRPNDVSDSMQYLSEMCCIGLKGKKNRQICSNAAFESPQNKCSK